MEEPGVYIGAQLNSDTGEIADFYHELQRFDVEVIAPTHPVYIRWAARRLQDRLEGLDRT
jgi:hypothetical protein